MRQVAIDRASGDDVMSLVSDRHDPAPARTGSAPAVPNAGQQHHPNVNHLHEQRGRSPRCSLHGFSLAAQQHPELYRAYIGVGQMVDPLETDGVFYTDALAWARRTVPTVSASRATAATPAMTRR